MAKYFGTYGIRRQLSKLSPEFACGMSAAFGTHMKGGKFIVGTDTRTSREMLKGAAIAGLLSAGCEVADIGVAPSPTLEFEVKKQGAKGGIIVTASHNPPDWNALKFVGKEGIGLSKENGEPVERIYDSGRQKRAKWDEIKQLTFYPHAIQDHISAILAHTNAAAIRGRKPFIILDCGNGTACGFAPLLFTRLGCRIRVMNGTPDGFFPGRNSEPTRENVAGLISAVKREKADMGIAWDGDGDRVIFIDEKGGYIWGDKSFALCAKIKMRKRKGTAVTTVATSDVVKEVVEQAGCRLAYVPVGAPYISQKMFKLKSVIGGEEVGGVVWPEIGWGKDGFMTAAKIVEEVCSSGKPLSLLIASLPAYFNAKSKVDSGAKDKARILLGIKKAFSGEKGAKATTVDGVRLNFADGWVIARPSGTENYFRVFAEAKTQAKADLLLAKFKKRVEEIVSGS